MRAVSPALEALLNKTDENYIPFAFMVPLRVIRIIADRTFRTFRVEQLIFTNKNPSDPRGSWRTLSTHGSETPGAMLETAMRAAQKAQNDLRGKLVNRAKLQMGVKQ
jgi:hypothetical protein